MNSMEHPVKDVAAICKSTPVAGDITFKQGDSMVWLHTAVDIKVSEPTTVLMTRCGGDNTLAKLALDATMPAHGHGMNYQPQITELIRNDNAVQYQAEGVVLHMPGTWQWHVDVRTDTGKHTLQHEFIVK